MRDAATVDIGNELLFGDIVDTNGSWLARRLEEAGVEGPAEPEREVEVVLKSSDAEALEAATGWIERALEEVLR